MKRNRFIVMIALVSISFANFGCSSSLSSLSTASNLLGVLGKNPNLSSFSGLLNKVPAVGKLLGGSSPLTVLAPSNDAISSLGQDALGSLTGSKDGLSQLTNLLKNHLVAGKVSASDLASGTLKTLAGNPVQLDAGSLVGNAESADNGVIQVINKVLQ